MISARTISSPGHPAPRCRLSRPPVVRRPARTGRFSASPPLARWGGPTWCGRRIPGHPRRTWLRCSRFWHLECRIRGVERGRRPPPPLPIPLRWLPWRCSRPASARSAQVLAGSTSGCSVRRCSVGSGGGLPLAGRAYVRPWGARGCAPVAGPAPWGPRRAALGAGLAAVASRGLHGCCSGGARGRCFDGCGWWCRELVWVVCCGWSVVPWWHGRPRSVCDCAPSVS
jgi:hypothetical protein